MELASSVLLAPTFGGDLSGRVSINGRTRLLYRRVYLERGNGYTRARARKYRCSKPDRCRSTRIDQLIRRSRSSRRILSEESVTAYATSRIMHTLSRCRGKHAKRLVRRWGAKTRWREMRGRGRRGARKRERRNRLDDYDEGENGRGRGEERKRERRKAGNELPCQRGQPVAGMWVRLSPL